MFRARQYKQNISMKKIEIYSFLSVASALFASYGFASEPVIIEGGTYSDAMYAVEGNTSGGSSLIINEGTFNLSSSVSKPDLYLYGGGTSGSIIEGDTFLQFNSGSVNPGSWSHSLYGGSSSSSTITGNSSVEINGGTLAGADLNRSGIFGGSRPGSVVEGNSSVVVNGGTITGMTIYGGGDGANTRFDGQMGTLSHYIDLGEQSVVKGNASVLIGENASVYSVVGGGRGNSVVGGDVKIDINGKANNVNIVGGTHGVVKGVATVNVSKTGTINGNLLSTGDIHGANVNYASDGSVASVVDASKVVVNANIEGNVSSVNLVGSFGSYNDPVSNVYGSVSLNIGNGANISSNVRAVALAAHVYGDVNINISGADTVLGKHVYAGSERGSVIEGNVSLNIDGATVKGDVYGGGYGVYLNDVEQSAVIKGSSSIILKNANVVGGVYAGGKGSLAITEGDASVTVLGKSISATLISGGGMGQTLNGVEMGNGVVKGSSTLAFGNGLETFEGAVSAQISNFDTVKISMASSVNFEKSFETGLLSVDSSAQVALAEGTKFEKLFVNFGSETFELGGVVDISEIFGDSTSVVMSEIENGSSFVVLDAKENLYTVGLNGSTLSITSEIPEPSTYAAILGALALAFAAYRRRK